METPLPKNEPQNPFDDDNKLIVDGPEKKNPEELNSEEHKPHTLTPEDEDADVLVGGHQSRQYGP